MKDINTNHHVIFGHNIAEEGDSLYKEYRKKWHDNPKDNVVGLSPLFLDVEISSGCNLRCPYCFHSDYFNGRPDTVKYADIIGFTTEQFRIWMETHIYSNFNEIVIHFAGGEPFFSSNTQMISSIANYIPHQVKFDFLTNGLFNDLGSCVLEQIIRRIHRVGCTYHRDTLTFKQAALFHNNVKILRDLGIPVYVKELLHKNHLLDILKHRNYWRDQGIDFKIQDIQSADPSLVNSIEQVCQLGIMQ